MIGGTAIVALCLLVLAWARDIVGLFVSDPDIKRHGTIVLAVLSIYGIDFAINAGKPDVPSMLRRSQPLLEQWYCRS